MNIEPKIKEDMRALGCTCERKIGLAFHLYTYLVDEKLMYDTEYCYNIDVDTLYVMARRYKGMKMNIYVPLPTSCSYSMEMIKKLQDNLCTVETGPTINLAFIEGDSTVVIYSLTDGLVDYQASDRVLFEEKKNKFALRNFINLELRKKHDEIMDNALNGGVVDDDYDEVLCMN